MNGLHWSWQGATLVAGAGLLACILVFALLATYRRLHARSMVRWLVVAALNVLAALALAALLNPPEWHVAADRATTLITAGAQVETLPDEAFITNEVELPADRASLLLHAGQLPLRQPAMGLLEIRGHGLDPAELRAFPGHLTVSFSPPSLEGITEPAWPRSVTVGALTTFSGRLVSSVEGAVDVELTDPSGQSVDRKRLAPGERFSFVFRPRAPGLAEYRVKVSRNGQAVGEERLALDVTPGRPVEILVLQSAPSFDTRQLRRWIGDRGSPVTIRTRISADHWITQGVNVGPGELDSELGPESLSRFDLLILDGRAWVDLAPQMKQVVAEAVERGLGLMILSDGSMSDPARSERHPLLAGFGLREGRSDRAHGRPILPGYSHDLEFPLSGLDIDETAVQPLLRDASGSLLEAWRDYGAGRVAISRLNERYRWVTSGNEAAYSAYWNRVLGVLARPRTAPYLLPPEETSILKPGRRARVCALGAGQPLRIGIIDPAGNAHVLPAEPPGIGGPEMCAFFWPELAGWHTVNLLGTDEGNLLDQGRLHVAQRQDWSTASWYLRQSETQDWIDRSASSGAQETAGAPAKQVKKPIDPLLPWLAFLLSSALLWIERRMDSEP